LFPARAFILLVSRFCALFSFLTSPLHDPEGIHGASNGLGWLNPLLAHLFLSTKHAVWIFRNLISYVTVRLNESQGAGNVCVSSSTCITEIGAFRLGWEQVLVHFYTVLMHFLYTWWIGFGWQRRCGLVVDAELISTCIYL
jgi:hypothetical protein